MSQQTLCPNPQCRQALQVPSTAAGQVLRCPRCQMQFQVPAPRSGPPGASGSMQSVGVARAQRTVGRYQLRSSLGSGSYGTVYRAFDPQLEREVAVKVLNNQAGGSQEVIERFLREARSSARLHHPNIVTVYDAGRDGETSYIASAFIDGPPLSKMIVAGGMEPRRAAAYLVQLLDALAYAHENGILHRDVKPANMLVDRHGHLFLTDFGLAGSTAPDAVRLTRNDAILGTPAYMPPEQALSQLERIGPASDLYSAGVVFYHLLTGQLPFDGPLAVVMYHVVHTAPVQPLYLRPGLCPHLNAMCMHLLAKHPEQRPQPARAMAMSLRQWLGSANAIPIPPPVPERSQAMQSLELMRTHASLGQHSTLGHDTRLARLSQTQALPPPGPSAVTRLARMLLALSVAMVMLALSVGGLIWLLRKDQQPTTPTQQTPTAPKPTLRGDVDALREQVANGRPLREYVEQNAAARLDDWRSAADGGQPEAQWLLGLCYLEGAGVGKDVVTAVVWFRKSAEQNCPWAQVSLGECCDYGLGEPRSPEKALEWYRKAAEQGHAPGQYRAAESLLRPAAQGQSVSAEGVDWLTRAAALDHPAAIVQFALYHMRGQPTERNYPKAIELYKKGIALNCSGPYANRTFRGNLALLYSSQAFDARVKDPAAAKRLLGEAIALNEDLVRDAPWHVLFQMRLGSNYFTLADLEAKDDKTTAAGHYRRAVDLHNQSAAKALADLYEQGSGVSRNPDEARRLRDRMANMGWTNFMVPSQIHGRPFTSRYYVYAREGDKDFLANEERRLREDSDVELLPETRTKLQELQAEAGRTGQSFRTLARDYYTPKQPPPKS